MREPLDNWNDGILTGRRKISNLSYVDDTTLIASDEEEITKLSSRVKTVSKKLGLRFNATKTKVMVIDRAECLLVSTGQAEKFKNFVYLGSMIEANRGCSEEIQRRITLGKSVMTRLRNITCNKKISRETRKTEEAYSITYLLCLLCVAETWTLKVGDKRRIDAPLRCGSGKGCCRYP